MRLHAITLRHYRRHRDLRVELDPQRTLIGGPNESGKSTLMEAAHRALFLKAKGTTELHKGMVSLLHAGQPEVELEFEAGGQRYTLVKTFGSRGNARLKRQDGATWAGDEAESRLAELLGAEAVGGGGAAARIGAQWAHLWIWQGSSGNDPLVQANAERDALLQRLQTEGGTAVLQSALDSRVAARFSSRCAELFRDNGEAKVGSELGRALAAEAEARAAEQRARAGLDRLQEAVAAHDQALREMAEAEAALQQLVPALAALEARARQVAELQRQEAQQRQDLETICRQHEARLEAERSLGELRATLEQKRAAQAPRREQLGAGQTRLTEVRAAADQAEAAHRAAGDALRQIRARHDLAAAEAALADRSALHARQQARQAKVAELLQRRAEIERAAAALPALDASKLRRLEDAERAHTTAAARLQGMATGIEVLAADQEVRLGGELLASGSRQILTAETELRIGGTRLQIHPGGGTSLAAARREAEDSSRQLAATLGELGVVSLAEAQGSLARRSQHESEWRALQAELKGLGAEQAAADLAAATRDLAAAEAEAARRRNALGETADAPWTVAEARTALQQAETAEHRARAAREIAWTRVQEAEKQLTSLLESSQQAERELQELETRLNLLLEQQGPDAARAEALTRLLTEKRLGEAQLQTTLQNLAGLQPEHLEAERARLTRAHDAQRHKQQNAGERQAVAVALLRSDGSSDPAAELALASARAESATEQRQAVERRARAVQRLNELFQEEQQALAEQFTRPLADRVSGYLQRLFGNRAQASVALEDRTFGSLALLRPDHGAFSFAQLSGGAREQVAAAFRLAMAELLAEAQGGCLPVVFDDAFAHSDPERVQRLQRMLDLAASRGLQIIVLTCTPADYAALGAAEIRLNALPA